MSDPRADWNVPKPAHIPRPTVWPPALALGISLTGWGLIASPVVLGVGALLFTVALAGWIGELRHEGRQS